MRDAFKFGKLKKLGASKQLSFNPAIEFLIHAICFNFHCEPGSASVELKQSDDHWRYECEYTSAQDGEPTEKSRHRRANVRYTVDFDINLSAVRRSQLLSSIKFVNFSPTAFSDVLSIGY